MNCIAVPLVLAVIALVAIVARLRANVARLRADLARLSDRVDQLTHARTAAPAMPTADTRDEPTSPVSERLNEMSPLSTKGELLRRLVDSETPAVLENAVAAQRDVAPKTTPETPGSSLPPLPSAARPFSGPARGAVAPGRQPTAALQSLEAMIGVRWPVWLGAIAIFLAGVFFVKYTFDTGMLTPRVRVILGASFGFALLGGGEWARRLKALIAQGLTAAGVAILFASFLAATNLYHFVAPPVGFGLLALTTAAAVGLSLRHGPFVALLGLVGGFLTPALIGADEPQPAAFFGYLLILQLGLLAVSRHRRWWVLSALTTLGGLVWTALWLATRYKPEHSVWLGAFVLLSCAASIAATLPRAAMPAGTKHALRLIAVLGSALSTGLLATLVAAGGFSTLDWCFLGLLSAGALVLSRLSPRYEPLPWFALLAAMAMLAVWAADVKRVDLSRFGWTLTLFGVGFPVGSYACLFGSPRPVNPAAQTLLSGVTAVLLGYSGFSYQPARWPWGWVCLIGATAYALMAIPLIARRARDEESLPLALILTGATALGSLALPIELEQKWIGTALALEVPALAWIIGWLHVPQLRPVAVVLSVLAATSILPPRLMGLPIGERVVLNWLAYGYGLTALAFGVAAWRFEKNGDRPLMLGHQAGCVALAVLLVLLNLRHGFHPNRLHAAVTTAREAATYVIAALLLALAALPLMRGTWKQTLRYASGVLTALSATAAALVLCIGVNPLRTAEAVGAQPIVNWLLYIYAVPALLLVLVGVIRSKAEPREYTAPLGIVAIILVFALVSFEVRQWFRGPNLAAGILSAAERYSYSLAWVALGIALLTGGILTRSLLLRWASLAVMLLSVCKVFLYDTAALRDLYRVFSLLGLGLSLMLLGFLYQRVVFRDFPTPKGARASDSGRSALSG